MSDTKILSGEWRVGGKVPLNVYQGDRPMFQCHTPEDAAMVVAKLNSHDAQAQRIAELEQGRDEALKIAELIKRQRNAGLRRAEAAEDQKSRRLLEALPAERAEEIADAFLGMRRMIRFAEMPGELRAYAAAAKGKR